MIKDIKSDPDNWLLAGFGVILCILAIVLL